MRDRSSAPLMELHQASLAASFGSAYLLRDISFSVDRGDKLAIIGATGSGKTTLLRLLNRLSSPTSGTIYLEEQPLSQIPVIQLRQQVVLVPQEPKLLGMSVRETLAYPLTLQKLPPKEIRQRVETWRNALRIPQEWLERNELQLSLGQRQLIAIARGLIMQPKVLLLDEPTSALDVGIANHLLTTINSLTEDGHTTIMMVNHQLELIQNFARRILYLETGKIKEDVVADRANWQRLQAKLLQTQAAEAEEWL
ncbi:MAG: ATP-binding cassette domain-containing protein [Xenococcaceae cyanobacterium MO_188.B32]|nr:ATP-binding cassette domain-containing protein [Xenococcaceae cyanobacterium MO_188.B32]